MAKLFRFVWIWIHCSLGCEFHLKIWYCYILTRISTILKQLNYSSFISLNFWMLISYKKMSNWRCICCIIKHSAYIFSKCLTYKPMLKRIKTTSIYFDLYYLYVSQLFVPDETKPCLNAVNAQHCLWPSRAYVHTLWSSCA